MEMMLAYGGVGLMCTLWASAFVAIGAEIMDGFRD